MSHNSWLKTLVDRVTKTPLSSRKRRFSPVKFDLLEDRTAPATLTWTGAAGTSWNNAGNWTGGGVPSAVNNVLVFDAASATGVTSNNDIVGLIGMTINVTDSSATKDLTISGLNLGLTALTNNKTDGVASSTTVDMQLTGVGATITATAGDLKVNNITNTFDAASNVNVPTGASVSMTVSPSGSLGSAKINLTGGTLNAGLNGPAFAFGFNVGQRAVGGGGAGHDPALLPDPALGFDVQPFPTMPDISRSVPGGDVPQQTNLRHWSNNHTFFYSGEIFFPNSNNDGTGTLSFAEQNDDDTLLIIDGVTYINNTQWDATNVSADPATGTEGGITLPTGWHDLDLRFGNGGGGAGPSGTTNGTDANWALGSGSTTNPDGKGFGYRVNSGPAGTDPLEASHDANDYKRLYADPAQNGDGVAVRIPTFPSGAATNNVSVSGSSTINMDPQLLGTTFGNLTMASGATLNVTTTATTTQTVTFGTTSVAGNFTFNPSANVVLKLSGALTETAASGLTKNGAGTLHLGAANTYTGATTINAGSVWAGANNALGSAGTVANGTTVMSGGQLLFKASYTAAEHLFLNGPGTTATNGALSSDATISNFPGPITLQSNATIAPVIATMNLSGGITAGNFQLTFGGAGNIGMRTKAITGTGNVVKTGTGVLNYNFANTYSGETIISGGTLRVFLEGALGTVAGGTTVTPGGTLDFVGSATFTTYAAVEPLKIAGSGSGVGALNSPGGDMTLSMPITLTSSATIGNSGTGKLIVNGTINMAGGATTLAFAGVGDIDVVSSFGNGSATLPVAGPANSLNQSYRYDSSGSRISYNLDGIGAGAGNGGSISPSTPFVASNYLTTQMNAGNTADPATAANANGSATSFATLFGKDPLPIANFVVLWSGEMIVSAPGTYRFGVGAVTGIAGLLDADAEVRVYLDKDRNGIFQDSTDEKLVINGSTMAAGIPLAAGTYNIAIPFTNGGGSGGVGVGFSSNDGGTWQVINPGLGAVANTRFAASSSLATNNGVTMNGTGVVTLLGNNTYNGTTTINSGTLVPATSTALGQASTANVVVNSGGTLGLKGGITLASVPIKINGNGATNQATGLTVGAINSLSGVNTLSGPITLVTSASIGSSSTTAGDVLNITGAITMPAISTITFTGPGNTVVSQPFGNGNSMVPGLVVGQSNISNDGALSAQPNPAFGSDVDLTITMGNKFGNDAPVIQTNLKTWATNDTWFYKGQMFWPNSNGNGTGTISFGENVDDSTYLWVDGQQYINDTAWNVPRTSGPITLPTGWHDFEVRFSNGGGGAGAVADGGVGWSNTKGFGYRINQDPTVGGPNGDLDPLASSVDGNDYEIPTDNGTGNLFRFGPSNHVIKTGAGTVTFNANNTYNGNTTVLGGTLIAGTAGALGSNPGATLSVSGAGSVLNLFDNASAVTTVGTANFSAGTGAVNTGAAAGKLAVTNKLQLGSGYTVTGNMTAQGANLVDNAATRTLSAVSGNLTVSHSPIVLPDNGQLFNTGSNQTSNLNYTADPSAKVLVVALSSRSGTGGVTATVSYDGIPMTLAAQSLGTVGTFVNSYIYYLYNPPTGSSRVLRVAYSAGLDTASAAYAFTLSGVDTNFTPPQASVDNTEGSPTTQTLTLTGVPSGGMAVSEFTYRIGANGPVGSGSNNGTAITTGANASGGSFWNANDGTIVSGGGLFANTNAGDATITATGAGASGSHFSFTATAFAPDPALVPIDLPKTNFFLPNGTSLTLNSLGANVIGNVTYAGNASIGGGVQVPTSLTVGGVGGAGTGTLTINNGMGLKLAAAGAYNVDLNGLTAGTQYDQTVVNGVVNLNGSTLNVATGFTPATGNSFTIISNDGTDAVVGTFAGLAQGATVSGGASNFTISYTGGDGNDVVLTAAGAATATTTTLQANPQSTTGGSLVTFTATIAPSPGAAGTVTFLDNGVAIPGGANVAVAGGQAVFSTSTLGVGVHPVTAAYSGGGGFGASTSAPVNVTITSGGTAPTVTSFTINGATPGFGGVQRSRVVDLTIVFDQAVQLDADAVTLALHPNVDFGGPQPGGVGALPTITVTPSSDNKTFTVTFSGANTVVDPGADGFPSLKDGVYDYAIVASKVHPLGTPGVNMAANSTGTFHRLFGDINPPTQTGNSLTAVVNTGDNLQFRNAFNKPVGGGYLPYFDVNGDGTINSGDNLQFRTRFNKALTWTV